MFAYFSSFNRRYNLVKTLSASWWWCGGGFAARDTSQSPDKYCILANASFCRLLYLFLLAAGSFLMAAMLTPDVQHNLQSAFKGLSSSCCYKTRNRLAGVGGGLYIIPSMVLCLQTVKYPIRGDISLKKSILKGGNGSGGKITSFVWGCSSYLSINIYKSDLIDFFYSSSNRETL